MEHSHRIVGVITEHYDDKIKLVVEQYVGLRKEVDGIKTVLDSHTEMIGELAVDMTVVKSDLKTIRNELGTKADAKNVAALDRRVDFLEAPKT